jgi:Cft2 family RNA processing exonuclease
MKITFLGGADEVGASSILVETADQLPDLSQLESGSGKLDAVLVTHSHTDHTGALELIALPRCPSLRHRAHPGADTRPARGFAPHHAEPSQRGG